jgi:hypothetical protein
MPGCGLGLVESDKTVMVSEKPICCLALYPCPVGYKFRPPGRMINDLILAGESPPENDLTG